MIDKDSIESAYCFFHQKWRVYEYSTSDTQKDDIEYAIASYVEQMNRSLYDWLSEGKSEFLTCHATFKDDMRKAIERLEGCL